MIRIIRLSILVLIWLALWSDLSAANVFSGAVVAAAIGLPSPAARRSGTVVVRPIRAARFAVYFLRKLVEANFIVARAVITPRHRIDSGVVAVPLRGCSDALATLIADSISLTPGTLTLEVRREPLTLFVHAFDLREVEQVQADVRRVEVLAIKAFGPREALADLEVDDTRSWKAK